MLFADLPLHARPLPLAPRCNACQLYRKCEHPKLEVQGTGKVPLMFVHAHPTTKDDARGRWKLDYQIQAVLEEAGVRASDCLLTGSLICKPDKPVTSDRLHDCLPNIVKAIADHKPVVVVLLGQEPVTSLITHYWGDSAELLNRWVGLKIPNQNPNMWICPVWDPMFLRFGRNEQDLYLRNTYARHLKEAVTLAQEGSRPWVEVPDYRSQVECIQDPAKAASIIRKMIRHGGLTAFDYEADRLKPDASDRRCVSCAICWRGKRTIAYPLLGDAVDATREYLKSDLPKIACNLKFEERWSMAAFKTRVRNWVWDTMLAAHYLDNREGVTSIKFQSYALLGQPKYSTGVEQTLKSTNASGVNQIYRGNLSALLLYNGLDALLEFEVAKRQMELLGYDHHQTAVT